MRPAYRTLVCLGQNLNHDADQIIFRDASFLTADAPQYERKFARVRRESKK
jgi:hypothetical protein